jgi:superfamily II DNA or RNA helicase
MAAQYDLFSPPAPAAEPDWWDLPDATGARWYQTEALERIKASLETNHSALTVMATGLGKGYLLALLAQQWDGRVLVLAHREELVTQLQAELERVTGEYVDIEKAEYYASHRTRIVVGSTQTLARRKERFSGDHFSLVIPDECFPAGTMIDGTPIEEVAVGDSVSCVDHDTGRLVTRRVARLFRKEASCLFVIRSGATVLRCTGNHPVFVRGRGYVEAKDIRPNDLLCVLSGVHGDLPVGFQAAGHVRQGVQSQDLIGDYGQDEPVTRECKDDSAQSDETGERPETCERDVEIHWSWTEGSWGERTRADQGGDCSVRGTGLANTCCCQDGDAAGQRVPAALQARRSECWPENSDRGRWLESPGADPESSGREEGRSVAWTRVDSVSREQSSGAGGVTVYNLEVEGSHTYFANGILVHNCHHYVSPTYRKVLEYFRDAKIAGFTATPDRGDEAALGQVFDEVAYLMDIEDGIDAGYLVPVRGKRVELREIELDEVSKTAGDLAAGQLDEAMKKAVEGIVAKTLELEPGRQGIVFLPGVESAEYCCHKFNERIPECAAFASANTDPYERKRIVQDFKQGRYKYLVNCMLYTEGFDAPNASLIVQARPTLSRALYAQMIGRGTRVLPGVVDGVGAKESSSLRRDLIARSAKPDMVVLDYVGNGSKHKLVTPEDVLGGNYTPEEVEEAKKDSRKKPGQDVRQALKEARSRLREMAARVKAKKVTAEVRCYDPFHALGVPIAEEERYANRFGGKLATDGQIQALSAKGVPDEELVGLSKRAASKLLDTLKARHEAGLATYKQMRQLKRYGVLNENITFERASAAITYIASKNWGRNGGIDPNALHSILNHKA